MALRSKKEKACVRLSESALSLSLSLCPCPARPGADLLLMLSFWPGAVTAAKPTSDDDPRPARNISRAVIGPLKYRRSVRLELPGISAQTIEKPGKKKNLVLELGDC